MVSTDPSLTDTVILVQPHVSGARRRVLFSPGTCMQWCPPGSVPRPFPFSVLVNDLPYVLPGSVLTFADDVKLISARSQCV